MSYDDRHEWRLYYKCVFAVDLALALALASVINYDRKFFGALLTDDSRVINYDLQSCSMSYEDRHEWRLYYKCVFAVDLALALALASVINYDRKWQNTLELYLWWL